MKAILDTHTFIWWDSEPTKLSATALSIIQDPANSIYVSVVSVWEILIKQQLGKLSLNARLAQFSRNSKRTGSSCFP